MASSARRSAIVELRQSAVATETVVDASPGSEMRIADPGRGLVEACADLSRKRHLADAGALGRQPTVDELAIFGSAEIAVGNALAALADWCPSTWEAFADKSEALALARCNGCAAPTAGLADLLEDFEWLVAEGGDDRPLDSAMPIWTAEVERFRRLGAEGENGEPAAELFHRLNGLLVAAPCTTVAGAALKLQALLDPDVGLDVAGPGDDDAPCLKQILAALERHTAPSALRDRHAAAERLAAEAEQMGYTDTGDGDTWLGIPLSEQADDLLDEVHLAPCGSAADALAKVDAIRVDLDAHADRDCLDFSLATVRAWLAGEPTSANEDIEPRAVNRARSAPSRPVAPSGEASYDALHDVLDHIGPALREYRERHPELRIGRG